MNPTNNSCPNDISAFVITDYRPSKSLYENVKNNNNFRMYMQQNAQQIRNKNLQNFVKSMNCSCEPKQKGSTTIPFSSKILDDFERIDLGGP